MDGGWRDVMTVVSGRGAHVPMLVGVLMEALQVMSLLMVVRVKALLLVYVLLMMKLEEVLLVSLSSLSLFTSPPTPTTRACGACLTQNISKAGDPDLGRGERTNWGRNLPAARFLFLLAEHQEGASAINFCFSDRGCLFAFSRYGPPRDARDERHVCPMTHVPPLSGLAARMCLH